MPSNHTATPPDSLTVPREAEVLMRAAVLGDMTCRQAALLVLVGANPGKATGDYADALDVQKPVVTRALTKAVALGLMHCGPHARDKRRNALTLTDAGLTALHTVTGVDF